MIWTDGIHLISDESLKELHEFAAKISLGKHWFHNPRGKYKPHYDIQPNYKIPALLRRIRDNGGHFCTDREIIDKLKRYQPNEKS